MRDFSLFSKLLASLVLSAAPCAAAFAGELDIYEHNGSVINWFVVNGEATATYATPKASLLASGIQEGSVVFKRLRREKPYFRHCLHVPKGMRPSAV